MKFKKKSAYNIAIMGATGAVGVEMRQILEERKFPIADITFLASERSAGKKIKFKGKSYTVKVLNDQSFEGVDIVLASAGGALSKKFAPAVKKAGAVMIDNTSAFRMDPKVPLVIPEINPEAIREHNGIIANPNCSTIVALVALNPLHKVAKLKRFNVATYQAASGAGAQAMEELRVQAGEILEGKQPTKKIFKHQIAFNVFSHNSSVGEDGYNEEETKMIKETHKILGKTGIKIQVTCVRVPVFRAHSEAIYAKFDKSITPDQARRILAKAPGVKVVDNRSGNYFPMPVDSAHKDDILVGRIRQDLFSKKTLGLFVSGDQIRKGAALNAVQIAEKLIGARR
jgi:aspartate-semialdehyde dehydrogenase